LRGASPSLERGSLLKVSGGEAASFLSRLRPAGASPPATRASCWPGAD